MMPPSGPPTKQEIWKIARRTIDIIEYYITSNVCLFGSAASTLWTGIDRVPNDIDIVVSENWLNPEDVKERIVEADDRYFLVPSRKPGATHQILHCRLPGWHTDGRCVKVDILVPPSLLNIPSISIYERNHIRGIPVMPIFDLLVMKTQGWRDHIKSNSRNKVYADVIDIFALLKRAMIQKVWYADEAKKPRHSQEFMSRACTLANQFVRDQGTLQLWRAIGFPVRVVATN